MALRKHYEDELIALQQDILKMGGAVENVLADSIRAMQEQDGEAAKAIIDGDDAIDDMMVEIEEEVLKLIATQSPLAKDLRNIFAAGKIVTDLERMADYSVAISKFTLNMLDEAYIKRFTDIPYMAEVTMGMLRDCLDAYVHMDDNLAIDVVLRDEKVDELYDSLFSELLMHAMENPAKMKQIINFMFIIRYLERLGDHITNIAEWIVYDVTGERAGE